MKVVWVGQFTSRFE